jgi:uncharacterized protein (TIGR03435 family)
MSTRSLTFIGIVMLAAPAMHAQSPANSAAHPSFEVASIKPNKSGETRRGMSMPRTDRFQQINVTLKQLIEGAYGSRAFQNLQIIGGPSWIDKDRFDVTAKIEDGAGTLEQLYMPDGKGSPGLATLMLRRLLEERFKLVVHTEMREMPIYALMLARSDGRLGPKLVRSEIDCEKAMAQQVDALRKTGKPLPLQPGQPPPCSIGGPPGKFAGNDITMRMFADALTTSVNRAISTPVTRVVVDRTGLAGSFKFTLDWSPDELAADASGGSIFTALQEQLGLKLEPARGPVDVLVVDHVEPPTPD